MAHVAQTQSHRSQSEVESWTQAPAVQPGPENRTDIEYDNAGLRFKSEATIDWCQMHYQDGDTEVH